nr:hypothetical protein [Myxococcales bacterium]
MHLHQQGLQLPALLADPLLSLAARSAAPRARVARRGLIAIAVVVLLLGGCGGSKSNGLADGNADVSVDVNAGDSADTALVEDLESDRTTPSDAGDSLSDPDLLGADGGGSDSDGEDAGELDLADDALDSGDDVQSDTEDTTDTAPPAPPQLFLTINRINALMNGSKPFDDGGNPVPYYYIVPTSGFTLDILPRPDTENGALDEKTLSVTCDAALGQEGAQLPANSELASYFVFDALEGSFSFKVPPELAFPKTVGEGSNVTCKASVKDTLGQPSGELSYVLTVDQMTPERDPFDQTDVWLVTFSRDNYTIGLPTTSNGGTTYDIPWEQKSNGIADFDEDLRAMGLASDDVAASAFVRAWLFESMRAYLHEFFLLGADGEIGPDSVKIKIFLEGDDGAPKPGDSGVSVMGVGGWDADTPEQPANGRANIDWNNKVANRDDVLGLGIFTTSMFDAVLANNFGVIFIKKFLPGVGQPVGTHPKDALILNDAFDPSTNTDSEAASRYSALKLLIRFGALALSSVIAHEMGHSLGLVPYGPPPEGLFGGVGVTEFTVQAVTSAHIDTPGLNIMQQGSQLNIAELLGGQNPFFNEPNLAYLRGRIIVLAP